MGAQLGRIKLSKSEEGESWKIRVHRREAKAAEGQEEEGAWRRNHREGGGGGGGHRGEEEEESCTGQARTERVSLRWLLQPLGGLSSLCLVPLEASFSPTRILGASARAWSQGSIPPAPSPAPEPTGCFHQPFFYLVPVLPRSPADPETAYSPPTRGLWSWAGDPAWVGEGGLCLQSLRPSKSPEAATPSPEGPHAAATAAPRLWPLPRREPPGPCQSPPETSRASRLTEQSISQWGSQGSPAAPLRLPLAGWPPCKPLQPQRVVQPRGATFPGSHGTEPAPAPGGNIPVLLPLRVAPQTSQTCHLWLCAPRRGRRNCKDCAIIPWPQVLISTAPGCRILRILLQIQRRPAAPTVSRGAPRLGPLPPAPAAAPPQPLAPHN